MSVWHGLSEAVGYRLSHVVDGEPSWIGDVPVGFAEAIRGIPPTIEEFVVIDLDTDPNALALATLLTAEQLLAVKAYQCHLIRTLRLATYKEEADPLFFCYEADGDSRDAWLAKRAEIKSRHPWPGTYR